ncbi:hypothetical protein [Sinorhizobium arboris]|nr:hypothetical protein [Sinorhizobium arboris]
MTDPNAYYAGGCGVELYDLFTGAGLAGLHRKFRSVTMSGSHAEVRQPFG